MIENKPADQNIALVLGEVDHGGANSVRLHVHLSDSTRICARGAGVECEPTLATAPTDVIDDLMAADVQEPCLHSRLPPVSERLDRSYCRHKHFLCHIFSRREVAEARERIGMHIGVKALEQSVPPVCLAALRGLYRLSETVGLCQARAATVGFIKYQVG
ncbi:MAG: hypothetical protein WB807_03195 [Candidatus Dormiibacterota bacterium]